MTRYLPCEDGEPIHIKWKTEGHKISCCSCSLVHLLDFDVKGSTLTMRAWRDNRATAARRRKR